MTNNISALQLFLLTTEYDACDLISSNTDTIVFNCFLEFIEEEHTVTCERFINDNEEEGYTIYAEHDGHKHEVTTRLTSDL